MSSNLKALQTLLQQLVVKEERQANALENTRAQIAELTATLDNVADITSANKRK